MKSVQVFSHFEIEAVKRGEIEGDVYRDGDVYATEYSLKAWRESPLNSAAHAAIPTLPLSDAVTP